MAYSTNSPYYSLSYGLGQLDPSEVYIDKIASMFTSDILDKYGSYSNEALNYLKQAGQAGIYGYGELSNIYNQAANQLSGLSSQYGNIPNTYKDIAEKIASAYTTGAENVDIQAQRAYEASKTGAYGQLSDTSKMLNYYKTMAASNQLPGQSLIEQNIGQSTASAINQLKKYGGSSSSLLGALTNVYGQQQQAVRDLGIQAAQYQAQNKAAQAQAAAQAIGLRSGAYNQLASAENLLGQNYAQTAAMRATGAQAGELYGSAQERALGAQQSALETATGWRSLGQTGLTQAQMSAAQNISDYYSNLAPQTANVLQSLMQQRLNAEQTQADLQRRALLDQAQIQGQALQFASDEERNAWLYNQMMQYNNLLNYYNSMQNATDPYKDWLQLYGEKAGLTYAAVQQDAYNNAVRNIQTQQNIAETSKLIPEIYKYFSNEQRPQ